MAEPIFDAPIPGSSLTTEVGSRPYKNPPKYSKVEDAIDFYIERMSTEEFTSKLVHSLKLGVSVAQIANIMQIHGVMEGQHTLDVSMLILPVLMEFIRFIADTRGIEYNMGLDEYDPKRADDALIVHSVRKLQAAPSDEVVDEDTLSTEEVEPPVEENASMGLMARGM